MKSDIREKMSLFRYINPLNVFRDFMRYPVEAFVMKQYSGYKQRTKDGLNSFKDILYRTGVVSVFLTAILWISIFMYVIFYYTYMPNVTHIRPVHLQFRSCDETAGICSFPSAHVRLTKRSSMLMSSQPYRVRLHIDMPESYVNKELGMFMVCAQLRAKGGILVSSSCRSAMMKYKSWIHYVIKTVVFSPFIVTGFCEEKQQLQVELFSNFEDDENFPVTDAYVELQSRFAQIYSSELHIEAHFTGLRYIMYHWPKVSAAIGICTNLFFVSLIFVLSWYHLQDGLPDILKLIQDRLGIESKTEYVKTFIGKVKLEKENAELDADDKKVGQEPSFNLSSKKGN